MADEHQIEGRTVNEIDGNDDTVATPDKVDTGAVTTEETHSTTTNRVRSVERLATAGSGTEADPYVFDASIFDGASPVRFPASGDDGTYYETSGVTLPSSVDWENTSLPVSGDSTRHALITLADNSGLGTNEGVIELPATDGNWAKFEALTIYGNKNNNTNGNGLYKPSGIIDVVIRDCVIRHCPTFASRINGSHSGSRIINNWFEQSQRGLVLGANGTRLKIGYNHMSGNEDGSSVSVTDSQFFGNTYYSNDRYGLRLDTTSDSTFTGETIKHDGSREALIIGHIGACEGNIFSALRVKGTQANVTLTTDANDNKLSGKVDGDVTIEGDNNDISGLDVGGTVTDNGTGNTT